MLVEGDGVEQPAHFILAQHDRQRGLSFRRRDDRLDRPVLFERHFIEKPERADRHEERAGRKLPLMHEIVLIGADLLGAEPLGRPAEVPGKLGHVLAVRRLRLLGEIPDPHVLDHPLAQWGHDALLGERSGDLLATPDARHVRRKAVKK